MDDLTKQIKITAAETAERVAYRIAVKVARETAKDVTNVMLRNNQATEKLKEQSLNPDHACRGGYSWTYNEDSRLQDEIKEAIFKIARTHRRTPWDIQCRLHDKKIADFTESY
jgi:hypothetical protein